MKFDLIHSNSSTIDIGQYIASKRKVPHIWHLREYGYEDYGISYIKNKYFVIKQYNKAQACIAISDSIYHYYKEKFPKIRIVKIYIGIVASQKEAFGRVSVEYMLSKMPVIGSNTGGTPEIIVDGLTGFLFEKSSKTELFEKMKYLIQNPEQIIKMGNEGYKRAAANFTLEQNTKKNYELYIQNLSM